MSMIELKCYASNFANITFYDLQIIITFFMN